MDNNWCKLRNKKYRFISTCTKKTNYLKVITIIK